MADQWFGQNWVVGKKDGRPLYMNVITGEMTSTAPPTNLSAVAARMNAVKKLIGHEPMDCENEHSAHSNSSSCAYAPNRKKKRLMCDIDAPAQFPVPRAQYLQTILSPPPIPIGGGCGMSPTSGTGRSMSPTSPLFNPDKTESFLQGDGFDIDLDMLMASHPSPTASSSSSQTVSSTSTPLANTSQTPSQLPTGFAPVPILPAGFPQVRMAQPVAEPLTAAQKATIRKIKRRESAEKSRQRRQAKLKTQEHQIQQLKQHIIKLNQKLAAAAAQNAAQREQINFLQSLVTSTIPGRPQT